MGGGWLLQWLLSVVAVYEPDEWEVAGCCSVCCRLLQCISRMNGRWLVVAVYEPDEWEVAGCCSNCCWLLQCMSK